MTLPVIPGYTIRGPLGHGGMGVVYEAEHLALRRIVALKVILAGGHADAEQLTRFRGEAEAIARLQHPNIIQIHEVGESDGRPYFAMEYAPGGGLDKKLAGVPLPAREAAALLEVLAGAIQAAHERGVIHRDLKPANVLLAADGTPKIADFGLAKRLDGTAPKTASGAVMGTPSYMSPEQATGRAAAIGAHSDVYALGAVLYELLTGRPPFKGTTDFDTLVQVLGQEPVSPRRLNPQVPPDLETICLKCLDKQPGRRYVSARELANDLRRFKLGEPIRARAVGAVERGWRWCRRKPVVASLIAAVVLVALAGTVVSWWFAAEANYRAGQEKLARGDADEKRVLAQANEQRAVKAEKEAEAKRQAAEDEKAIAIGVTEFLQFDLLLQADSRLQANQGFDPMPNLTVKEALRRAAERIGNRFHDQPLVEASIRLTIGQAYAGIGEAKLGIPHLERALTLRTEKLGVDDIQTLVSAGSLASAYNMAGRFIESRQLDKQTWELRKKKLGAFDPQTLVSMNNFATSCRATGRLAEAIRLLEEALQLHKEKLGTEHPNTLGIMHSLVWAYLEGSRLAEAIHFGEEVVRLRKLKIGGNHPDFLSSLNTLANAYLAAGRSDEALQLFERVMKDSKSKLGVDHSETLDSMNDLGAAFLETKQPNRALHLLSEALVLCKLKLGNDHYTTLAVMSNLARAHLALGQWNDALAINIVTLDLRKKKMGVDHPATLISMNNLGETYRTMGRFSDAITLHRETLELRKARSGIDHLNTLTSMHNLAITTFQIGGQLLDAILLFEETLKLQKITGSSLAKVA